MVDRGTPAHFGVYLKTAFLHRWNLLCFFGGLAFALLSGQADVFVPLVAAAEIAYVGLLAAHPRFQAYVDARTARVVQQSGSVVAEQTLHRIATLLPPKSMQRFEALRVRCLELRQIALEMRDPTRSGSPLPLEELHIAGLDRLLWIYLRLLYASYALERFLQKTSERDIQSDITGLENKLRQTGDIADEAQRQKVCKAIEDNLQTCRDRLANYQKARDNSDLIQLEIDRLENKIRALSEAAVNRQEPDYVTTQVDQVAASLVQTERTMSELQFATGLEPADEAVPALLNRESIVVTK